MNKIKAILIDDENKACLNLKRLIEKHCPYTDVIAMSKDADDAYVKINTLAPDVILLDVHMPGLSGFDLLKKFDKKFFKVIFVTAYSEYALQAIKQSAIDYLLKPIDKTELQTALLKVKEQIESERERTLNGSHKNSRLVPLSVQDGIIFMHPENIIRLEADGSYTTVFTADKKKYIISKNIKEVEKLLAADDFFRCHQSHLVNIHFVSRFTHNLSGNFAEMSDGSKVDIARRRKEEFLAIMQRH